MPELIISVLLTFGRALKVSLRIGNAKSINLGMVTAGIYDLLNCIKDITALFILKKTLTTTLIFETILVFFFLKKSGIYFYPFNASNMNYCDF